LGVEKSMAEVLSIVKQDFAAAKAAFDQRDFPQMNIFSNRLMSNLVFGEREQKELVLPGLFLKDVASDFLALREEAITDELHKSAATSITKIGEVISSDLDLVRFWNVYTEYYKNLRKLSMSPIERQAYKDNIPFTWAAMLFLSKEIFEGKALFVENGLILKGFLQEADRLMRCHGAQSRELVAFSLVKVLDWLNEYYRVMFSSVGAGIDLAAVKSRLSPFLERIKDWFQNSEELPYMNATGILCDGILEWRICYINYLERGRGPMESERRIELPVEAKKRIGDTIAEALQKDVATRRGKNKR
jgi:hypothetical protein